MFVALQSGRAGIVHILRLVRACSGRRRRVGPSVKPGRLLPLKLINMEPHRDQKRPESCSRNFLDWSENAVSLRVTRVLHEAKLLFMKLGMQRLEAGGREIVPHGVCVSVRDAAPSCASKN